MSTITLHSIDYGLKKFKFSSSDHAQDPCQSTFRLDSDNSTRVSPGRYDIVLEEKDVPRQFYQLAQTALVAEFVRKSGYTHPKVKFGALITEKDAANGELHRDVYPLQVVPDRLVVDNYPEARDLWIPVYEHYVPCFYMTLLMDIVYDDTTGQTEFYPDEDGDHLGEPVVLGKPGDAVVFDGRIVHRGQANRSKKNRVTLYATATAPWYRFHRSCGYRDYWESRRPTGIKIRDGQVLP